MSPTRFHRTTPQWAEHSISALGLAREGAGQWPYSSNATNFAPGRPFVLCVGLARHADLNRLKEAWDAHDDQRLGELLGYPECCRRFFHRVWVEGAHVDTTWQMALNSGDATRSATLIEVAGPALVNILYRWTGVRGVPHLPCSFDCVASAAFAQQLQDVGTSVGFVEEMAWVREILSWPAEWSALHGIAEIKTPIVKISTRTDATSIKYAVRRPGEAYPSEGATAVRFPYRPPASTVQERKALTLHASAPAWHHTDNGFRSESSMARAHAPVVGLASRAIGGGGAILDLGCGNGILLKKICDRLGNDAIPFGVDAHHEHIAHARDILPNFASNFRVGDIFASGDLSPLDRRYRLVLIGINRLLEASGERGRQLADEIQKRSDFVLVYRYPSASESAQDLDLLARQFGLRLTDRAIDSAVAAAVAEGRR
jgi:2-polyprenyl-3-methyl-5-hydroxy-6-metoxy-1,4-benzoquinol methylase